MLKLNDIKIVGIVKVTGTLELKRNSLMIAPTRPKRRRAFSV
jgi:hypothetical protein